MLMKMKRPTESISDAHRRIGAATSTFSLDNIHSTLAKHCYKKKKKSILLMFRISTANLTFKTFHLTCKNENRRKKTVTCEKQPNSQHLKDKNENSSGC